MAGWIEAFGEDGGVFYANKRHNLVQRWGRGEVVVVVVVVVMMMIAVKLTIIAITMMIMIICSGRCVC